MENRMVSVIVPVYNIESYLDKCLSSILTNTYRDLEVICVNDGSTDKCPEILRKWKDRDCRVIVIDQENRGLPEARNSGLDAATGEYIAFVDSDDWVHPRYFESMLDCMETNTADMVVCGCREFEPEEEVETDPGLEPNYRKLTAQEFYKTYYARHMVWARMMRQRDTEMLRFPPEVMALQDTLYNLRLIAGLQQPTVYATDAPLYYYLQRPGSLVRTHTYQHRMKFADWYVKNRGTPDQRSPGNWAWMLPLEATSIALSCRYEAAIRKDREMTEHADELLRTLCRDLMKDRGVSLADKATRLMMFRSPQLYRLFRLYNDPTLREHERLVSPENRFKEQSAAP